MVKRLLAHEVVVEGETFKLHCVRVDHDGKLIVEPFAGETPGTIFVEGRVEVWYDSGAQSLVWRKLGD